MAEAELNGVRIHYVESGDGLPYVFCNGLGGNNAGFVAEDLPWYAERFRVVSWDQRGLGQSGPAGKYSLPLYAADLAALLDHLEIERAVVHGVSWGGVLTQRFALDYPDRCAAIVLDSTSSEVNVGASENWYARGELARLGAEALGDRELAPAFEGHETVSAAPPRPDVAPEHVDSYVAQARATGSLREHPLTPYLSRISCPTLVVGGGNDVVAGAAGSVIISRQVPGAELHVLDGVGHGVYRQARDEFRSLLMGFLERAELLTG